MDELSYRVSDAERDQVVVTLREHLLEGRLTLDEFSDRAGLALQAGVARDLQVLQRDLPVAVPESGARSQRKPVRATVAVFGHVVRRGRLRLKRRSLSLSVFGDVDLDLREASIDSARTTVTVFAFMGNADIYVPEGIDVDVSGLTVFGHRRDWGRDVSYRDAPTLHVRALGVFGTVDVWRVPPSMKGDYKKIVNKVRKGRYSEPPLGLTAPARLTKRPD